MDMLREVVYILDRYKVRQIDVLTNVPSDPSNKENRYYECYKMLRDGQWQTDSDLAAYLGMAPGSKAFVRFKNELLKRLLNSTLFLDTSLSEFTDYTRAHTIVVQRWAVAMTLWSRGVKYSFIELAYQLLGIALKYEFVDLVCEITRYLKAGIVPYPQFNRNYPKIKALHEEYRQALHAEIEVRDAYESLLLPLTNRKGYKKTFAPVARELSARLRPLAIKYPQSVLQKQFRLIEIYGDLLEHNWQQALVKARAARLFFREKPFETRHNQFAFAQQEMGCLIMLGQFAEARKTGKDALQLTTEGVFNWFKARELLVVCDLYMADYPEAWKSCKEIVRHSRFKEISEMDQETWFLFQGYLNFIVKIDKISLSPREKGEADKFRLSSWVNSLPLYSQDKRGANVPILIVQALLLLMDKRMEEFDSRVEALRKYRQRNLDPACEHYRTNCFIRLLELVTKFAGRPAELQKNAQKWLDALSVVSNDLLDRSFEIEVVPYERQWAWVMEILEKKT